MTVVRFMANSCKPFVKRICLGAVFTTFYALTVLLTPVISQYLIDVTIPSKDPNAMFFGLTLFFMICLSQPLSGYLKDIVFNNVSEAIGHRMRTGAFSAFIRAKWYEIQKWRSSDLIMRIFNDPLQMSQFTSTFFTMMVKNIMLVLVIVCGMLYYSASITLISMSLLIFMSWMTHVLSKNLSQKQSVVFSKYDTLCAVISETADGVEFLKAQGGLGVQNDLFVSHSETLRKLNVNLLNLSSAINSLTNAAMVGVLTIIYGMGSVMVMQERMTLGSVIALGLFFQQLIPPIYELIYGNLGIKKCAPSVERIMQIQGLPKEQGGNFAGSRMIYDFKNVTFSYTANENDEILSVVNHRFPEIGWVSIVGPSGMGKSTVLKLLAGLIEPVRGSVRLDFNCLKDWNKVLLRERIGYLPQQPVFFEKTLRENLLINQMYCAEEVSQVTDEHLWRLIEQLGLKDRIVDLPSGLDTILDKSFDFSVGEFQRLGIVRAMVHEPRILLLDEPSAALDEESASRLIEVLKNYSKTHLIILVTHEDQLIEQSTSILEIKFGKIMERPRTSKEQSNQETIRSS